MNFDQLFDKCSETVKDKIIVVQEDNRKFTLINEELTKVIKIKVDKCLITSQEIKKCDWIFLIINHKIAIYIELKGKNLEYAFEQLKETFENENIKDKIKQKFNNQDAKKKYWYVICTRCPLNSTEIANKQKDFLQKYQIHLRIKNSEPPVKLKQLLSKK